jgi:hypothetical protein
MLGEVIGNYRIVSEIGRGGMGMVYRGEHVQLGRPAAIKMLHPQLSAEASIVQRFFNEARAASAIDHPGIVEIYDFGRHRDGRAYIVMALLTGESLAQRLARGGLPPHDAATIIAQAVAALAAAHARGIVHRDLKPDNIFLVPNELVPGGIQVKLLDFGIAKLADEQTAGFKTQTGALLGTPAYMSPEQCMGRADLDHRTDVYSIGCILFHLFCGRPPFMSDQGTGMMIAAHIRDAAPDPRSFNPHLPAPLAAIALRCLEKDPAARFQTATELRNALVAAGANAPLSRPGLGAGYDPTLAGPASSVGAVAAAPSSAPMGPIGSMAPAPMGPAPTTRGGAAAQMMSTAPATAPASGQRSRAPIVVGGLLVAIAGIGVGVAVTRGGGEDRAGGSAAAAQATTGGAATAGGAATNTATAGGTTASNTIASNATAGGTTAGGATAGGPRTGGSGARDAVPSTGSAANKQVAPNRDSQTQAVIATGSTTAGAPRFQLDASSYAPGDEIEIRFARPVSSKPQSRSWITVIESNRPASAYGEWAYLEDGATVTLLKAPSRPGAYEVRLHTDYPAKSHNVQGTARLSVAVPAELEPESAVTPLSSQRFTLATSAVRGGAKITLAFAAPMRAAPREQFWVTVVEVGTPDSKWGAYEYVTAGARRMQIAAPAKPGEYEVRLHANYPTKTTNVVHRAAIRIEQ